jgi:hypothetical protein
MKIHPPQTVPPSKPGDPQNGYQVWETELGDGCRAIVRTATRDDALRVVSVYFDCGDGGEPSTGTLRLFLLGEFRLHALEWLRTHPGLLELPYVAFLREGLDQGQELSDPRKHERLVSLLEESSRSASSATRRLRKGPNKGRHAANPDHYRDVAIRYLELLPEHKQRVIRAMADHLGYSPNTVSTWVRRAREEGWLSRGTQGKAGGEPGPKLIEWMENEE